MSELSVPIATPLRERLPRYAARLQKLEANHERWLAQREKALHKRLKHELGVIGMLGNQSSPQLESECYILSHEQFGRLRREVQTTHLAWDLGEETQDSSPDYESHLYLTHSDRRFYVGDSGFARPYHPLVTSGLLSRIQALRSQLEEPDKK